MVTLSFPIDDALARSLEETAKESGVSAADFVAEAVRVALADRRYREAVARGLAAVKAGRVVDSDAMERWLRSWGDEDEAQPPACDG
jgi:predicted transcriptional regulator